MYKLALVLMLFLPRAFSASVDLTNLWSSFKSLHSKTYSAAEDRIRFCIIENNTRRIAHHNLEADFGLHTYKMAVNLFAAQTQKELDSMACVKNEHLDRHGSTDYHGTFLPNSSIPDSIDYRSKGLVTGVKNQGQCNDCYIFAAVGALETAAAISKKSNLVSLSEQNVLDCGMKTCDKGASPNVYKYIISNKGIDTETSYPYTGKVEKCRFEQKNVGATLSSFKTITNSHDETLAVVAQQGPVAAYINSSPDTFKKYSKGIYKDPKCNMPVDHAVVIVGYGQENGEKFWILKNSWGADWGEKGFMRLSRGADMCGIMFFIMVPVVK